MVLEKNTIKTVLIELAITSMAKEKAIFYSKTLEVIKHVKSGMMVNIQPFLKNHARKLEG